MDWQAQRDMAAIRRGIKFAHWDDIAGLIVKCRTETEKPIAGAPSTWAPELTNLTRNGITKVPLIVDTSEMKRYFDAQATLPGSHAYSPNKNYRYYPAETVLRAPGIVDLFNHPELLSFVEQYLGCVPTLYSINAWWSDVPEAYEDNLLQIFHRDIDDWRFVVLFLYLTDTDEETGAHQVILGTHKTEDDGLGVHFSAKMEHKYRDRIFSATGPKGTMHLVNTLALHRGLVPVKAPRLMAWCRFGLGENTNSYNLEAGPLARRQIPANLEDTPRNRHINRLIIDWERGNY